MKIFNPVSLSLFCLTILVQCFLPLLGVAPNRIIRPASLFYSDCYTNPVLISNTLLQLFLLALILLPPTKLRLLLMLAVCALLTFSLSLFCAQFAEQGTQLSQRTRFSFGGGFWLLTLLWLLIGLDRLQQCVSVFWQKTTLGLCMSLPLTLLFMSNYVTHLSLVQEYYANIDTFQQAFAEHLSIVALTLLFTLPIAFLLGTSCHSFPQFGLVCLHALGLLQTIPSIALFGLLLEPLALLSRAYPWLSQVGIKGIGIAPAVIALILYSLLPVVRGIVTGLDEISAQTLDAASGLGMKNYQLLINVKLPLALPVILSGVRVMCVQTIGLTMVAALIGAGGFGAIMFRGLANSALDLTLLGVMPVVMMAMITDMLFRLLEQWSHYTYAFTKVRDQVRQND